MCFVGNLVFFAAVKKFSRARIDKLVAVVRVLETRCSTFLLCNKKRNIVIISQSIVKLHSLQALVVDLEVTEGKQHCCTFAKFLVLYVYHMTSIMLCNN